MNLQQRVDLVAEHKLLTPPSHYPFEIQVEKGADAYAVFDNFIDMRDFIVEYPAFFDGYEVCFESCEIYLGRLN